MNWLGEAAKRRMPWIDHERMNALHERMKGHELDRAMGEILIEMFAQWTERQSAPNTATDGQCRRCGASPRWCECKVPLLGPGDE